MKRIADTSGSWGLGAGDSELGTSELGTRGWDFTELPVLAPSPQPLHLPQVHRQRRATVQAARLLSRVVVLRTLFAVADGAQPIRADAAADQVVLHRVRAPVAERQVVFRRADVARVAFDLDAQRRVLAHR